MSAGPSVPGRDDANRPGRARRGLLCAKLALLVIAILLLGASEREDRYSCHVCRALKEVRTASLLLWRVPRHETVSFPGRAIPGHAHDWWRYSYAYANGLGGCLGSGVGCQPSRYRDGEAAHREAPETLRIPLLEISHRPPAVRRRNAGLRSTGHPEHAVMS